MLEKALTQLLRHADISAIGQGVYADDIPKGSAMPALSYSVIADNPVNTIDQTGPRRATVQINSVADNKESAHQLAKIVRNTLPNQRGTFSALNIQCIVESSTIPSFDDGSGTHRRIQDFTIHYSE